MIVMFLCMRIFYFFDKRLKRAVGSGNIIEAACMTGIGEELSVGSFITDPSVVLCAVRARDPKDNTRRTRNNFLINEITCITAIRLSKQLCIACRIKL